MGATHSGLTNEPHRLSKPRTNTNSASGAPLLDLPSRTVSPFVVQHLDHLSSGSSDVYQPRLDSNAAFQDSFSNASPGSDTTTDEAIGELATQVRDALCNLSRHNSIASQAPADPTGRARSMTASSAAPALSLFPAASPQPRIDLEATISLLQELRKNASPQDLVALHRALLPGNASQRGPSQPLAPQAVRPRYSSGLIRRRSLATPGLATRGPGDLLRKPSQAVFQADPPPEQTWSSESLVPQPLHVLPRPEFAESARAQTPGSISHLGALQLGSLVITNGAASPPASTRSVFPGKKSEDSEEGYFTSSEGRVSIDVASRPSRPGTSRSAASSKQDASSIANDYRSEIASSPFVHGRRQSETSTYSQDSGLGEPSPFQLNRAETFPAVNPELESPTKERTMRPQRRRHAKTDSATSAASFKINPTAPLTPLPGSAPSTSVPLYGDIPCGLDTRDQHDFNLADNSANRKMLSRRGSDFFTRPFLTSNGELTPPSIPFANERRASLAKSLASEPGSTASTPKKLQKHKDVTPSRLSSQASTPNFSKSRRLSSSTGLDSKSYMDLAASGRASMDQSARPLKAQSSFQRHHRTMSERGAIKTSSRLFDGLVGFRRKHRREDVFSMQADPNISQPPGLASEGHPASDIPTRAPTLPQISPGPTRTEPSYLSNQRDRTLSLTSSRQHGDYWASPRQFTSFSATSSPVHTNFSRRSSSAAVHSPLRGEFDVNSHNVALGSTATPAPRKRHSRISATAVNALVQAEYGGNPRCYEAGPKGSRIKQDHINVVSREHENGPQTDCIDLPPTHKPLPPVPRHRASKPELGQHQAKNESSFDHGHNGLSRRLYRHNRSNTACIASSQPRPWDYEKEPLQSQPQTETYSTLPTDGSFLFAMSGADLSKDAYMAPRGVPSPERSRTAGFGSKRSVSISRLRLREERSSFFKKA